MQSSGHTGLRHLQIYVRLTIGSDFYLPPCGALRVNQKDLLPALFSFFVFRAREMNRICLNVI